MNDVVWVKLIENLPAIVTALGVIVTAYLSYRTNQQGKATATKLETVEKSVNGQSEKLLALTRISSKAEGVLEERESQQTLSIPDVVNVKLVEEEK